MTAASLATWNAIRTHVQALHGFLPPERALSSRLTVAEWTGWSGSAARARDLLRELTPFMERVRGPEHFRTLTTRHALARWTGNADLAARVGQAGEVAKARDRYAVLVLIRQRILGLDHPDTDNSAWLGVLDMLAAVTPTLARIVGDLHPRVLLARHHLARWTGIAAVRRRLGICTQNYSHNWNRLLVPTGRKP